jgi:hypothetical protein
MEMSASKALRTGRLNHRSIISYFVFVQEAKKCFEEALERATAEAEEDEKYYKLIAITIRLASVTVPYCTLCLKHGCVSRSGKLYPDSIGSVDSGSGSRRAKMTHESRKNLKISCFEVLDVLF